MVYEIRDYSRWTVANAEYVAMDPIVAGMCASNPMKKPVHFPVKGTTGPHEKKWIKVYINRRGEAPMLTQKSPKFPVGTVIVKEKFPSVKIYGKGKTQPTEIAGPSPELLTVMIKREANYDKTNGDWEFMVTDGKGEKVSERGKLSSCQSCHKPYEKTDYVVRSYLPDSVKKALKDLDNVKSEPVRIEPAK